MEVYTELSNAFVRRLALRGLTSTNPEIKEAAEKVWKHSTARTPPNNSECWHGQRDGPALTRCRSSSLAMLHHVRRASEAHLPGLPSSGHRERYCLPLDKLA